MDDAQFEAARAAQAFQARQDNRDQVQAMADMASRTALFESVVTRVADLDELIYGDIPNESTASEEWPGFAYVQVEIWPSQWLPVLNRFTPRVGQVVLCARSENGGPVVVGPESGDGREKLEIWGAPSVSQLDSATNQYPALSVNPTGRRVGPESMGWPLTAGPLFWHAEDDFEGAGTANGAIGRLGWNSNAVAAVTKLGDDGPMHPGILQVVSDNVNGNAGVLFLPSNISHYANTGLDIYFIMSKPSGQGTTWDMGCGLTNNATAAGVFTPTEGFFFHAVNGGRPALRMRHGGVQIFGTTNTDWPEMSAYVDQYVAFHLGWRHDEDNPSIAYYFGNVGSVSQIFNVPPSNYSRMAADVEVVAANRVGLCSPFAAIMPKAAATRSLRVDWFGVHHGPLFR